MEELRMLHTLYEMVVQRLDGDALAEIPIGTMDADGNLNSELQSMYWRLFSELVKDIPNQEYICCSEDLGDPVYTGDFDFLTSWLTPAIPFLYMRGSHPFVYPSRVIIYGPSIQMTVDSDKPYIETCQVNMGIRKSFFATGPSKRTQLIAMLRQSDRPDITRTIDNGMQMIQDAKDRAINILHQHGIY